ncbi:hypothetical protein [Francisella sp. 19S2-4]|uniref:hypothetical protein n=2 Tax=unclassified Francisella TaxID=2610885 RepID=UPI002E360199|nr:hypothetical protein [Francisella sp. 19S2-4]MED7820249.1 hypothetical protein [Francisella sp. 19S2-4]MED7831084.1 hypothetical protein [Francisella sp. 19S2-10]
MKYIYNISKSIIILVIISMPNMLLAFVNISFIPTSGSTLNLVATQNSTTSTTLDLELRSINGNQLQSTGISRTIATALTVSNAITIPISLSNNQITDRIIVIPLSAGDIFSTVCVLNADLTIPNCANILADLGATPTLTTTPMVISNNAGIFIVFGTSSTLRIYRLDPTDNSLTPELINTYNAQNIERILPIDENIIAVILRASLTNNISADIRGIITNTSMGEYSLDSANNIQVTYDPSKFRTSIGPSGSQVDISNAPSPYGVNKVFSQ